MYIIILYKQIIRRTAVDFIFQFVFALRFGDGQNTRNDK